ncbi:MAG: sigma factor [Planctomycetota bacterium]|jgi:hypothetical protein
MRDYTERIWKEYRDRLHSFIEARVDDTHTADDILQEVFVRIHSQVGSLRNRDKIQSWIYQITRNAVEFEIEEYKGAGQDCRIGFDWVRFGFVFASLKGV